MHTLHCSYRQCFLGNSAIEMVWRLTLSAQNLKTKYTVILHIWHIFACYVPYLSTANIVRDRELHKLCVLQCMHSIWHRLWHAHVHLWRGWAVLTARAVAVMYGHHDIWLNSGYEFWVWSHIVINRLESDSSVWSYYAASTNSSQVNISRTSSW